MSSTSNVQNYLSNVFRPYYVYDPTNGYRVNLEISNVTTVAQEVIEVEQLLIGDSNRNVYVGVNAGNVPSLSAEKTCCNVTAFGYGAGNSISNVSNSVYIGTNAGEFAVLSDRVIAIGGGAVGQGTSNIYIGTNTGPTSNGSGNILIGHQMSVSGSISNTMYIGRDSNYTISANLSNMRVGIGGVATPTQSLDVSGNAYISRNIGIGTNAPTQALDVSGGAQITSNIRLNSGTVAVPSYTFNSDLSSGMYLQGASQIAFTTGGIQRVCISGANVRIAGDLTVQGDVSANGVTFNIGKLMTIDGTAQVPSHTFSNDASSGMYRSGTNQVAFSTVGVQRMVLSNGSVGIGTATPTQTLDVSGTARVTTSIVTGYGTSNLPSYAFDGDVNTGMYRFNTSHLGFSTGGKMRMLVNNTGLSIGTGVAVNGVALDVSGTATIRSDLSASRLMSLNGTSARPTHTFTTDLSSGMYLQDTNQLAFSTTGVQRMVLSNGSVGIGTATPANELDVVGVSRTTGLLATYIRNALTPTTLDISGGNIAYSGGITGSTANTYNRIGGVVLSNNDITLSGTIIGSTVNTSNSIGGVVLSNNNIGLEGTITGFTVNTSNSIGGVVLSNNNVRSGNGTSALPTHTFNADLSSGMYRPGTNQIGFATAGVQRLVLSNGSVGIGTGAPTQTVDVVGTVLARTAMRTGVGSAGAPSYTFDNESTTGFYLQNNNEIGFATQGVQRGVISGNRFGIGTATPSRTLDVVGDISASRITVLNGTAALPSYTFNTDLSSGMYLQAASQLGFTTAGVQRMCISGTNVGIGISAPTQPLEVYGNIKSNFLELSNAITVTGYNAAVKSSAPSKVWRQIASSSNGNFMIAASSNNYIYLSSNSGSNWLELNAASNPGSGVWRSVASSADGLTLFAAIDSVATGGIWRSIDGGSNWSNVLATARQWFGISCSASGSNVIAAAANVNGFLYRSSDGGLTWSSNQQAQTGKSWFGVALSSNGLVGYATERAAGFVYKTINGGSNWAAIPWWTSGEWFGVGCSADGNVLITGELGGTGRLVVSRDGGLTSNAVVAGNASSQWWDTTCSADGTKMAAVDSVTRKLWTSIDSGLSWTSNATAEAGTDSVTMSADGSKGAATNSYTVGGGAGIYTFSLATSTVTTGANSYISAARGTESAPSHTFNSDLSSGMFLQDISQIGFATGGVDRMCISGSDILLLNDVIPAAFQVDTFSTASGPSSTAGAAMTYDGTVQYTRTSAGIYTSINSGAAWNLVSGSPSGGGFIACSTTTGSVVAASSGTVISYSVNGGTWTNSVSPATSLTTQGIAINGSGSVIYVANFNSGILVGTYNFVSGAYEWTNTATNIAWVGVVTNETGDRAAAVVENGSIWYTSNRGLSWAALTSAGTNAWYGIASSSSGQVLVAVARTGGVWISLDFGGTWNRSVAAGLTLDYRRVGCSSDGQRIIVSAHNEKLYVTRDGGATWIPKGANSSWSAVAMSSSGGVSIASEGASLFVLNYSPATPSRVTGTLSGNRIAFSSGTRSAPSYTFSNDLSSGMFLQNTGQVGFTTGGIQRMCISGGLIGIGTSNPSYALDISTSSTLGVRVSGSAYPNIKFVAPNDASSGEILLDSTAALGKFIVRTGVGTPLTFETNGSSERMRILPGGNVGIGTNAPTRILDVSGDITNQGGPDSQWGHVRIKRQGAGSPTDKPTGFIEFWEGCNAATRYGYIGFGTSVGYTMSVDVSASLIFATSNLERMRINSAGNVGINTITPGYTLDVSGTFAADTAEYTVYVTSNQTVTVPSGFSKAIVTAVGGGGGGGSTTSTGGGGGGGSGYVVTQLITPLEASYLCTLGGGGPAVTAGTITTVGTRIVARGGFPGATATTGNGGAGGAGGYGGGGGGGNSTSVGGAGGIGKIEDGYAGLTNTGNSGLGGSGGGTSNAGNVVATTNGAGGGGGGPTGGGGGGVNQIAASLGGGGGGATTVLAARSGAMGYVIFRFLR